MLRSDWVKVTISSVLVKAETVCDTPLNATVELPVNPLPSMSRVKGPPPAPPEAGVRPVITGTGFDEAAKTVKLAGLELPPPGGGLITTTAKFPANARSETLRIIDSEPPFKKEAAWATPLKVTVDKAMNPLPLSVSVRGALDAAGVEAGDRLVITGCGLFVTVKVIELELPPPGGGLLTTTAKLPAVEKSDAVRVMVS